MFIIGVVSRFSTFVMHSKFTFCIANTKFIITVLREIRVQDLLQERENELPRRLLLLGRPESGKTALFALILHHWLHDDKSWVS